MSCIYRGKCGRAATQGKGGGRGGKLREMKDKEVVYTGYQFCNSALLFFTLLLFALGTTAAAKPAD